MEKIMKAKNGLIVLSLGFLLEVLFLFLFFSMENVIFIILIILTPILVFSGIKIVKPNEARAFMLFGNYIGCIKEPGIYYINPFSISVKDKTILENSFIDTTDINGKVSIKKYSSSVSLKTRTLLNQKQKINDELGNPIEIGIAVIWKVQNISKALFDVENYHEYLSIQCDTVLRDIVRSYPYDLANSNVEDSNEKTLRGSSKEIANLLKSEMQKKAEIAGIEIIDARITHLAYATEIAAAMLQRQQAAAIVDARQLIVEGAVGLVQMAINKLSEDNVIELDDERKAQMVSNLMVVLCANKEAQPIVNSGSLY